jgi:hypothetical protein
VTAAPAAADEEGMHCEAVVVLVGITADRAKRKAVRRGLSRFRTSDVFVPCLPYRLGLTVCAVWLRTYLKVRVLPRRYKTIHFVNYIGGRFVFQLAAPFLSDAGLGRIVYIRSPLQERVPKRLVERYTAFLVLLAKGWGVLELARMRMDGPWTSDKTQQEQGVLVEQEPSYLARKLGLSRAAVPRAAWDHSAMLVGASDVVDVSVSHDEAYSDPVLLSRIHEFVETGSFGRHEIAHGV